LNLATEEFDISAITMDRRTGNHFLQVKQKTSRGSTSVDSLSHLYEPLAYPLLFADGEPGWSQINRKGDTADCFKIKFPDYLASRMLMPERYQTWEAQHMNSDDGSDPHYGKYGRLCSTLTIPSVDFFSLPIDLNAIIVSARRMLWIKCRGLWIKDWNSQDRISLIFLEMIVDKMLLMTIQMMNMSILVNLESICLLQRGQVRAVEQEEQHVGVVAVPAVVVQQQTLQRPLALNLPRSQLIPDLIPRFWATIFMEVLAI
jgi:hypothetical protein